MVRKTKDSQKQVISKQSHIIAVENYKGDIPHPSIVAGYEQMCPGATERILKMAESETYHRQQLQNKELDNAIDLRTKELEYNIKYNTRGQIFTFILLLSCILGGIILLYLGRDIGGYGMLITSVISVVAILVNQSKKNDKWFYLLSTWNKIQVLFYSFINIPKSL